MIPGPRPSKGPDLAREGRCPGVVDLPPAGVATGPGSESSGTSPRLPVGLIRTARGWVVTSPAGTEDAGSLVEGLSLADLVAEELGGPTEPDRTARRSARGPAGAVAPTDPAAARIAALERTVAQLEHALAARVATERAIGVLAERHGTSARAAFESLRQDARSQGRSVAELAREVLDGFDAPGRGTAPGRAVPSGPSRRTTVVAVVPPPTPRTPAGRSTVAAGDGAP